MKTGRHDLCSLPVFSMLLIAAILPFASGYLPTVRFASERIDVHVYPGEILVDGHYFYRNPFPFPVLQGFSIPFPIDRDHPQPIDLHVERLTPGAEPLRIRHLFGSVGFDAFFLGREEVEIRVSYRQKAGGENAAYILTTTRPWGRPLESGKYTLYPHGTIIESSNYPLDTAGKAPGFNKTGFMPDQDWHFTWRKQYERKI